jgi:MFS family permease
MTRAPDSPSQRAIPDTLPASLTQGNGPQNGSRFDFSKQPIADQSIPEEPPNGPSLTAPVEMVNRPVSVLQVLQNRNFLFLWAGQVFSQLADKVYLVLMIALITTRFQSEGQTVSGWVSAVMVAFTIPAVLFGSFAGVLVDRWPKKWTMILTNVLRGALVLMLPALLWALQSQGSFLQVPIGFWAVLGVTFLVSTLTQFFAPAEQSTIPLIVERSQLLSANSLYTFTMMLAVIVGFAAGDPLLNLANLALASIPGVAPFSREIVVGGSYAVAGLLLLFLTTHEVSRPQVSDWGQVWDDIRDGLQFIDAHRRIKGALIQLIILFSIFAALAVLVVRMAEILPEIAPSQFGFLLAAGGVGMAIGITLLNRVVHRVSYRQLSFYGSTGLGLALAGLAFNTHHLWPSLGLLVLVGASAALVGVPMQTTIQEQTPEELRGKVFGLQNNAVNIALSLPLALAGVAETFLGLQWVFLGLATLVMTGGLLTWYISGTTEFASHDPIE